jgi:hypothetical protein
MNISKSSGPCSVSIKNKLQVFRLLSTIHFRSPLLWSVPPRGRRGVVGGAVEGERERGAGSEVGGLLVYSLSTGLTRLYTSTNRLPHL